MSQSSPTAPGPDPSIAAWSRVHGYAERLFEALDKLDELGGAARVAASQGWSPAAIDRALGTLQACREGLTTGIARLDSRRRNCPRRRRIG